MRSCTTEFPEHEAYTNNMFDGPPLWFLGRVLAYLKLIVYGLQTLLYLLLSEMHHAGSKFFNGWGSQTNNRKIERPSYPISGRLKRVIILVACQSVFAELADTDIRNTVEVNRRNCVSRMKRNTMIAIPHSIVIPFHLLFLSHLSRVRRATQKAGRHCCAWQKCIQSDSGLSVSPID